MKKALKSVSVKALPFAIKSTAFLINIFAVFAFLLVVAVYIADQVYANGAYLGRLMRLLFEAGFPTNTFSITTGVGTAFLFALCLAFLLLKRKIVKAYKATGKKFKLLEMSLYSLGNITINIFLLLGAITILANFVVFSYVNTIFSSYFDSGLNTTTADKMEQVYAHLQDSKASASLVLHKIMLDVQLDPKYIESLNDETYKTLCYEINGLMEQKGGPENREEHYFRNYFDRAPKTLDEMTETILGGGGSFGWRLMPVTDSLFHMNGDDGEYNLKFVSDDGFFEAVYNKEGKLLTAENDPRNMGTYNYADPTKDSANHSLYDVAPFLRWGNTLLTSFSLEELDEYLNYEHYENNPDAQARYVEISTLLGGST